MTTKLVYTEDGRIWQIIPSHLWFRRKINLNVPYNIFGIDELDPDNKSLVDDLEFSLNKLDSQGRQKYTVELDPADNELKIAELEGWVEHVEENIS